MIDTFHAFPMPHIEELLEIIAQAHYILTLDLPKGYWQIPMAWEDRSKTAFGTHLGLYEFTHIPLGLHGAAAIFQQLMEQILVPHVICFCIHR